MDNRQFDAWTVKLTTGAGDRRAAVRLLAGGALGALGAPPASLLGRAETAAAACSANGKACKADGGCCSGFCERAGKCAKKGKLTGKCRCRCPQGTTECGAKLCCEAGQECQGGTCVGACVPDCAGKVCGDDGCGGDCGDCGPGYECEDGACVVSRFGCQGGDNYCFDGFPFPRCPNSGNDRCTCITDVEGTAWCAYTNHTLYCSTCTTNADCLEGWACYDARGLCNCPNSGGEYQGKACAPVGCPG